MRSTCPRTTRYLSLPLVLLPYPYHPVRPLLERVLLWRENERRGGWRSGCQPYHGPVRQPPAQCISSGSLPGFRRWEKPPSTAYIANYNRAFETEPEHVKGHPMGIINERQEYTTRSSWLVENFRQHLRSDDWLQNEKADMNPITGSPHGKQ
jgi:hypothetical protein